MNTEVFKWLGLLAIIILAFAGSWVVRKNGVHWHRSLSQHAGLAQRTFVVFGIASTLAIVLFYIFMQEWFIPTFQPPTLFNYTIVAGLACQLVAAWVPHTDADPLAARIHRTFAYTMAVLMPLTLVVLLFSPAISETDKYLVGLSSLAMAAEYLLHRTIKNMQKRYFLYQLI